MQKKYGPDTTLSGNLKDLTYVQALQAPEYM